MENKWHEKLFDFSSNPSYITITCEGIEPRTTGCKSNTLTRDYLPAFKSMVNIKLKYVTLNTTYAFNRSPIFVPGSLPVSINGYGVPFLSYYACTPHRPPQAASVRRWKISRSVLFGNLIHDSTLLLAIVFSEF